MARVIEGRPQNTIDLKGGEQTTLDFTKLKGSPGLEMMNVTGGTVWLKWHDDAAAEIGGATSTPMLPGITYYRKNFPRSETLKLGMLAETDSVFIVNII